MKNYKLKNLNLLQILFAVIISVAISCLFTMHYLTHVYTLNAGHSMSIIQTNKSLQLLQKKMTDYHSKEVIKPAVFVE